MIPARPRPAVDETTDAEFRDLLTGQLPIDWRDHIHQEPAILVGKPVVKGTRLSVEFILERYGAGWNGAQVLENYPPLTPEAIRAVFAFASDQGRGQYLDHHAVEPR